jgi:ketosteroid isomerase-like protein
MQRFFWLIVALWLVVTPTLAQENKKAMKPNNAVEQAVLQLEQNWEDALLKSDTAALEKIYDDSLVYTHSNAAVDDKATYIANIKSGASKYVSLKRDEIKVKVYGDTALVYSHWLVQSISRGNTVNTNGRYLHVYVKQKDGWKMVAHQATRIAQ